MVTTHDEPLLSSPTKKFRTPCKALLLALSSAAVICLTSFITIQLSATNVSSLHPSDLCINSPNSTACHVIVSDILTISNHEPTPLHVFNHLVAKSLHQIKSIEHEINQPINGLDEQSALTDCALLMDLSHNRLIDSFVAVASGSYTDARTWLSAVLTNHITCLDGLSGPTRSRLGSRLNILVDSASATLAVLNALDSSISGQHDEAIRPVLDFPAWMDFHERKLLEASSAKGINANVIVAKDGSGKYKTVQEAVNSAPDKGNSRYVIYVKKGVYKENVNIGKEKTNVMIMGDGMDATVITGSSNVVDGSTTYDSATLAANGDGLILQDLKIQNTAGPEKHQAVALRVSADRSAINRCKIEAYQDTLYAHTLRQFYRDSYVTGTVDYIFGNAAVVLQKCILVARKPMPEQKNAVTAQGRTDPNQNTGTSIQQCRIIPASDLAPAKDSLPTYLGRPWKMYSRTVVMQSFIDSHIHPRGWLEWDGDFALKTLFYGEYMNSGPGAGTGGRVKWPGYKVITDANTAKSFTVGGLIQGGSWLKSTGVAYIEGL